MSFTDHQFVEAVELLQGLTTPTGSRNKRCARRVEIRMPVDIRLAADSDSPWFVAQIRDLSARGIRLQVDRAIAADSFFLLRLPTKHGKKCAVPLICRVIHCMPDKDLFVIGAEFSGYATPEESVSESAEQLDRIRRSILD
ncbi:MAG: PilZ domain-containing protein [Tepidisphaeraceae bacterium]|jgi:PilZ domain-containing protein